MRSDFPAKVVVASAIVGLGLITFRVLRLAGVCLALAGGKGRVNRIVEDVAAKDH